MVAASSFFTRRFGADPGFVLDSPGRINIIGDHTDYCGLPVLPVAMQHVVQVAGATREEPGIEAASTLEASTPDGMPGWDRYVHAVNDQLASHNTRHLGAQLAFDADLPSTGGLSSSSAVAIGTVFTLNELWGLGLEADEAVALAVAAERQAAVAGGAMDQTVITFAQPGHALRIDFDPAGLTQVPIPESFRWVAGYSGTKAPKGTTAADAYNSFVLASRAAAVLLGRELDRPVGSPPQLSAVRDADASFIAGLPTLIVSEAAELTGGDNLALPADRPLDLEVSAAHVLSEAQRVVDAEAALLAGDQREMGRLMNESHASLRAYGSSTEGLDRLVASALAAGANGARVSGAGFGGWAVALADDATVVAVTEAMTAACGGPAFEVLASGGVLWSLEQRRGR